MRFASVFVSFAIAAVALAAAPPPPPGPPSGPPNPPGSASDKPWETPESYAKKSLKAGKCRSVEYRKEWRALSKAEQRDYLSAVVCLSKRPHSDKLQVVYPRPSQAPIAANSSFYDDMVYIHMDQVSVIHSTGLFLPWHRWYIDQHLRELRSQCGYKGVLPYWEASKDAPDLKNAVVYQKDAFGGWGEEANDYVVQDGLLTNMTLAYPVSHHLRRQWTPQPWLKKTYYVPFRDQEAWVSVMPDVVDAAINGCVGDFNCFHNLTEPPHTLHTAIHGMSGGDLGGGCPKDDPLGCLGGGPTFSSNDPLFFLHHANIDRMWFMWQLRHKENFDLFVGGSKQAAGAPMECLGTPPMMDKSAKLPTNGLFPEKTIADMMDPMGGYLCYIYI